MVPVSMKGMRYKYTCILSPHESTDIKLNHNMNMNKNHFRMSIHEMRHVLWVTGVT